MQNCRRNQKRVPMQLACWLINDDDIVCYHSFDISATGISVYSSQPLPQEKVVELQFYLPSCSTPVSVTAKVVWSNEDDDKNMGLMFLEKDRNTLELIKSIADKFI